MKSTLFKVWFALLPLFFMAQCVSQPATGTPAFGSFSGSPDAINLGNLNAHWDMPIRHKAGRGTDFNYDLTYDSSVWYPVTSGSTKVWQPVTNWGWQGLTPASQVYANYNMSYSSGKCGQYGEGSWQAWSYGSLIYHDEHGITHNFNAGGSYIISSGGTACPPGGASPTGTIRAPDGLGVIAYWSVGQGVLNAYFVKTDGTSINAPLYVNYAPPGSSSLTSTDANGNQITMSNGTYTDTLGQTALGITGTAPNNTLLSYQNGSGGYSTYTVSYASKSIKTNFGCSGIGEYNASSVPLVSSISLPDGRSYQFTYESTPGYSGYTTGRVASVTLPTGGTITYSYTGGSNGIVCADGSTAGLTRSNTVDSGSWSYSRTGSGTQWTTTVLAPSYQSAQDKTIISFLTNGANFYEIQRQVYDRSSTILETMLHCYESSSSNCSSTIGDSGTSVQLPITRVATTYQWPNSGGISSGTLDLYDSAGYQTSHEVHDHATGGTYGALLQATTTTYSNAYSPYGLELPTEATVTDGQSNMLSDTKYSYTPTTTATSGTPQHVSGSPALYSMNSVQRWVTGSTYQSTIFAYFDTGNVQTKTDPNGTSVTTYTYGNCGNSFLTGASTPVKNPGGTVTATLTSAETWNCVGGIPTSSTDANGNTTSYGYGSDPYWRPVSVSDAAGNSTSFSYPTSSTPTTSSSLLTFNGGSSVTNPVTVTDGLGREWLKQNSQGPSASNYDSIAISYDSHGRQACVSEVPYSAALRVYNAPTSANAACTSYDALGRPETVTDAGGGTTSYTYSVNGSLLTNNELVTIGPAPALENTKKRLLGFNGAGQLKSVCEITSLSGSGSCGTNSGQSGYLTQYTYVGGLLTKTQQNVQAGSGSTQTRTVSYDGLGRRVSETIPEWSAGNGVAGTSTYTYDSDSSGVCSGSSAGDLIKTVDNLANVICNSYDSLHRLLTSTAVSGTYASVTPTVSYVYDAGSYGGTAMQNAKGNLAEAYTGTSSSKITDLYFSNSYSTSGATTGGVISQVWASTQHSGGYFFTTETYYPNGALGARTGSYGIPNVSYGLDGEGRTSTATDSSHSINLISGTTFNTASTATGVTYGNGDSDTFSYDPSTNRPASLVYSIAGGSPFTMTTNLTWNANWSMQQMQITDTNDSSKNQTCTYSADDLRRLASVNCGSNTWAQNFTYDAFGNINKAGVGNATSYQYAYNAITNQVSGGPSYDKNGNQLNSTGLSSISWNAVAQPVSITPLNGLTVGGIFDALGRLVETTSGATYAQFVFSPAGAKVAVVRGGSLLKGMTPLPGGETAVYNASGLNFIRHKDWLSSSRLATTWAHGVYSKESYAPFGETYNEAGTPDRSFTGQDQDIVTGAAATGVYEFLFRKYDPAAGRWMSPDPAGWGAVNLANPQSLDRYAYVENQPMIYIDPMGLWIWSMGNCYFDTVAVSVDGESQGYDTQSLGCYNQPSAPQPPQQPNQPEQPNQPNQPKIDCSKSPVMPPTPTGANINANESATKSHGFNWWLVQVRPGGNWDYKQGGQQYTSFGNVNYGATCDALGNSLEYCQRGAGKAAYATATWNAMWGKGWSAGPGDPGGSPANDNGMPDYGDQAGGFENQSVIAGFGYAQWQKGCQQ